MVGERCGKQDQGMGSGEVISLSLWEHNQKTVL